MNPPSTRQKIGLIRGLLITLLVLAAGSVRGHAQTKDDLTMVFLYNFAVMTQWPANAFPNDNAPFVVGIVGRPKFADAFYSAVHDRDVIGRSFEVHKLADANGADACQIIFIEDSSRVETILAATKGKPVLCVGNSTDFIKAGGMIALSQVGAKIVFDVNLPAFTAARLKPSPRLINVARSTKEN